MQDAGGCPSFLKKYFSSIHLEAKMQLEDANLSMFTGASSDKRAALFLLLAPREYKTLQGPDFSGVLKQLLSFEPIH